MQREKNQSHILALAETKKKKSSMTLDREHRKRPEKRREGISKSDRSDAIGIQWNEWGEGFRQGFGRMKGKNEELSFVAFHCQKTRTRVELSASIKI